MKRRYLAFLQVLLLLLGLCATVCSAGAIARSRAYRPGVFFDVKETDWYATGVKTVFEYSLMNGSATNSFKPAANLTVGEALAIACRLHSGFANNRRTFPQGNPWYKIYVDYAVSNGIMRAGQLDPTKQITREQFAYLMWGAVPAGQMNAINTVTILPDVAEKSTYGAFVYRLYRAGVLTGSDAYGSFRPTTNIQRAEVATIVSRIIDRTQRKTFTLAKPEIQTAGKTRLAVSESTTWTAKAVPSDGKTRLSWAAGNPGVATVDQNGRITAKKAGQCNITITASNGLKKTILVTVGNASSTVSSVSVKSINTAGKTKINAGETTTWTASVNPSNATNRSLSWAAGNPGVATVDQNGRITAKKAGQCNITITAANGVKKTILLTVVNPAPKVTNVPVTGINTSGKTQIKVGETTTWTASVNPSNATNRSRSWAAGNPGVATVDQNGRITAKKAGDCNITITAANGVKKTVMVHVTLNARDAYAPIIQRFRNAFYEANANNHFVGRFWALYLNGEEVSVPCEVFALPEKIYYHYYDINHDGIEELVFANGRESPQEVLMVFSFDGMNVKLLENFEPRGHVEIHTDGTIRSYGSAGAAVYIEEYYTLQAGTGNRVMRYQYTFDTTDMSDNQAAAEKRRIAAEIAKLNIGPVVQLSESTGYRILS